MFEPYVISLENLFIHMYPGMSSQYMNLANGVVIVYGASLYEAPVIVP